MAKKRKKTSSKRKKSKPARKKKSVRRRTKRREGPLARAYHTVTGTISDTGKLRKKMEQPGTDETE